MSASSMLTPLPVKPAIYTANVDENGFENNSYLDTIRAIAAEVGAVVVPVCNLLKRK